MTIKELLTQIDSLESGWQKAVEGIEEDSWKRISALTTSLEVDQNGNIKKTVANLKKIGRIRALAKNTMYSKDYKKAVRELEKGFIEVTDNHKTYFEEIAGSTSREAFVNELQTLAIQQLKEQITTTAIGEAADEIANMIENDIKAGNSFAELQKKVEEIIMGNDKVPGRLRANTYQIVTDSVNQHAGILNQNFSEQLGLDWFEYTGGIIETTRPFCKALMRKRYVHRSEFGQVASGKINGVQVSKAGMINPTTKDNLTIVRGGYNCKHQLYAIPIERVPKRLRKKFE